MLLNFAKDADKTEWAAKHKNAGKPSAHIEIKRTFSSRLGPCSLLLLVALDGWEYRKTGSGVREVREPCQTWDRIDTRGFNIRMSMNGPMAVTFDDFDEINEVIEEAKKILLETRQWKDAEEHLVDTVSLIK